LIAMYICALYLVLKDKVKKGTHIWYLNAIDRLFKRKNLHVAIQVNLSTLYY